MTDRQLLIEGRFEGFPGVALGGYVAGALAERIGPAAAVRLRSPVPLGARLRREPAAAEGRWVLRHGQGVVAEGWPETLDIDVPSCPSHAEAREASARYPGFLHHLFAGCFCCGPARPAGEGLRVFVGPVAGDDVLAGLWTPPASMADGPGHVPRSVVWSALDCPGLWALVTSSPPESADRVVTGTLHLEIRGPVIAGEDHVVVAWPRGELGRQRFAGAAVFDADGRARAVARQTCVTTDRGVPLGWHAWTAESERRS